MHGISVGCIPLSTFRMKTINNFICTYVIFSDNTHHKFTMMFSTNTKTLPTGKLRKINNNKQFESLSQLECRISKISLPEDTKNANTITLTTTHFSKTLNANHHCVALTDYPSF